MQTTSTTSKTESFKQGVSTQVQECIDKCLECFESCSSTIPHCLEMGGDHASTDHIGLLSLCADICQSSVKAMEFNVELKDKVCDLCAEVCNMCADECERMAEGDQKMISCARICRECAEACKSMMQ